MHLIRKNHIEVQCSEKPFANLLKDELSGVFEHELYPKLEQLLDRYDVADRVWSIEHLSVDIPAISKKHWKQELVDNILFQVEEYLKLHALLPHDEVAATEKKKHPSISKKKALQELLLYYLERGTLPTNALLQELDVLFETVEIDSAFWEQLLTKVQMEPAVVLRWTFNVPQSVKAKLYEAVDIDAIRTWGSVRSILMKAVEEEFSVAPQKSIEDFGHFLFWMAVFQREKGERKDTILSEKILRLATSYFQLSPEILGTVLSLWEKQEATIPLPTLSKTILYLKTYLAENEFEVFGAVKEEVNEKDDIEAILEALQGSREESQSHTQSPMDHSVYIQNAGLVLLHPFLAPLFQKLGYLEDTKWKRVQLQHRAVLVLQYLSNFDIEIFESDLLLNKILCGVKPTDTVRTEWEITAEEKEECDSLLQAVIDHWSILKDTSVPTLQETFLQRDGKLLEYKENKYELTLEQKGLDILLDHLPWGIGTIKTPWMEHFLSCYWN
ncbi:contractile injection system tape measure protein [Aureisphaera galaxeae]|uniref:contractile injection system tape measure protein n=1 Tax=Aureisphaera galaxeae TaxID=1538023 RepID=UPI002350CE73|nr:contractile injection system tape measure protein [Aureisphaera galaxeae]MDC8005360.1 contractile injection system tape measure protein [Aureisphaera galaxeae]